MLANAAGVFRANPDDVAAVVLKDAFAAPATQRSLLGGVDAMIRGGGASAAADMGMGVGWAPLLLEETSSG